LSSLKPTGDGGKTEFDAEFDAELNEQQPNFAHATKDKGKSRVFDILNTEADANTNNDKDAVPSPVPNPEPAVIDDTTNKQSVRRSTRSKHTVERMSFSAQTHHSPLKSLVKGFLLRLAFHSNYVSIKSKPVMFQGSHPEVNSNPKQFNLGCLSSSEAAKLRDLQTLDMLTDLTDPDPDDHLWKCIAVTKHKVWSLNKDDVHVKVKATWGDGEETWI
jgi:hypothetical protein